MSGIWLETDPSSETLRRRSRDKYRNRRSYAPGGGILSFSETTPPGGKLKKGARVPTLPRGDVYPGGMSTPGELTKLLVHPRVLILCFRHNGRSELDSYFISARYLLHGLLLGVRDGLE